MKPRNIHILHADDDPDDRWLFEDGLKRCGDFPLTQFEDGDALLEFIQGLGASAASDIAIVCDMQMRHLGGVDVLSRLRQLPGWEATPVIIFSTSSFSVDVRSCLDKGAFAFYSKPDTLHDSFNVIREMIDSVMALSPA